MVILCPAPVAAQVLVVPCGLPVLDPLFGT